MSAPILTRYKYNCTSCGNKFERDKLTVKKVIFAFMGEGGSTKKSRVVAWLCGNCLQQDEQYTMQKGEFLSKVRA